MSIYIQNSKTGDNEDLINFVRKSNPTSAKKKTKNPHYAQLTNRQLLCSIDTGCIW